MFMILVFITYIMCEICNYIAYCHKYKILNEFTSDPNGSDVDIVHKRVKLLHDDISNHVLNKSDQINDFIYSLPKQDVHRQELADQPYSARAVPRQSNVHRQELTSHQKHLWHKTILDKLYYPHHNDSTDEHMETIKGIVKLGNMYDDNNDGYDDISDNKNTIKKNLQTWYRPLCIVALTKIIKFNVDMFLLYNGFRRTVCDNGMNIWFRKGKIGNRCTVFVHASIGGLIIYKNFIKQLSRNDSVILLEIPGIAVGNDVMVPPTVYQMVESLVNFIISKKNNGIQSINLVGHSFGCNFVSCLINRFENTLAKEKIEIDKTIIVEGLVFVPRVLRIFNFFDDSAIETAKKIMNEGNYSDLLSIPFFYRDLYLQFYMQKCLTITDNLLMQHTDYEKKDGKIFLILSRNDNKIAVDDVIHYLSSKQYKCDIKIYDDRRHGDFAFYDDMQQYVLDILKT